MRRQILALTIMISLAFSFEATFVSDSLNGSLGDVITFGWQVQHDEASSLAFTELDMTGSGIELLHSEILPTNIGSKIMFRAAVYDSVGSYTFPSTVAYLSGPAGLDSLYLRGPDLQIHSVLTPSDTTFRDIKDLHKIKTPMNFWMLLLIFVAFLGMVALTLFWKRLRKGALDEGQPQVIIPPEEAHITALRALEALKRAKYIRLEQYKVFYSQLTHILKQYYENRYLIDALEQTTSEFLDTMVAMPEFDEKMTSETHQLLERADFIKFAKAKSDELESGKALNLVIDLVNRTKVQTNQGDNP